MLLWTNSYNKNHAARVGAVVSVKYSKGKISKMARDEYKLLRDKGYRLAGNLGDLAQRASVYHHMYQDSGGRNVFPLIAAHGALWASGYFKKGMIAGRVLSIEFLLRGVKRKYKIGSLYEFADKFRDINRQVCAEAYALYHCTKDYLDISALNPGYEYSPRLIQLLSGCHQSSVFTLEQRGELFYEFFKWEQENIVTPAVLSAYEEFDWGTIKRLALKPNVKFAYFGGRNLRFEDFSSKKERVDKGLQAYFRAEEVGLKHVEGALYKYGVLPTQFFENPAKFHAQLSASLNV